MSWLKDTVEIASGIATIIVIVAGGLWTYLLFVRQRTRFPHAELEMTVHHTPIAPGKRLLHAGLRITNTGHVLLRPQHTEIRVRQVIPLCPNMDLSVDPDIDPIPKGKHELEWPLVAEREWRQAFEVEPGESDTLHADFVLDQDVQQVQLYAFVGNPTRRRQDFGWALTQFVTMREDSVSEDKKRTRTDDSVKKQQRRQGVQEKRQQQQQPKQIPKQQPKKSKK